MQYVLQQGEQAMSELQKAKFRAFLFGMGSVLDVSGKSVMALPRMGDFEILAHDFHRVGESIATAVEEAGPGIAEESAKQLPLKLNA
jgi:hypothetical protein